MHARKLHGKIWFRFWACPQVRLADTMQLTGLHAADNAELLQLRSQARATAATPHMRLMLPKCFRF